MDARKTGALIAALRKEKGLSQKDLAERLGVTNKAISRWETGRGYPDIEIIPALCRELGISVQELLDGQRSPQPDQSVERVCQYAAREQRRQSRIIMALAAVIILLAAVEFYCRLPGFVQLVVGSKNCIIAADYEGLTYYGQAYLPLPMNGYEAVTGAVLVEECQIEGYGFWGKLLFGEKLLEVRGVPDQELVYLQTENDSASNYYVLASEFEKYEQLLMDGTYDHYYANNWGLKEFQLHGQTWQLISDCGATDEYDPYHAGGGFFVFAYEENHIFYRCEGEVTKYDGGFCWSPYVYREEFDSFMMSDTYYKIDEGAWDTLEMIHRAFAES